MSGHGNPTQEAREYEIDKAMKAGRVIVYGEPTVLQLDLDSREQYDQAASLIRHFKSHLGIDNVYWTESKSGNCHIYIDLNDPMPREDRIAWQGFLGSDRIREALNYLWFRDGRTAECFLVENADYVLHPLEL
jgi:hypothetical protein